MLVAKPDIENEARKAAGESAMNCEAYSSSTEPVAKLNEMVNGHVV